MIRLPLLTSILAFTLVSNCQGFTPSLRSPLRGIASPSLPIRMAASNAEVQQEENTGVNWGLVGLNLANQALIGSTIWFGGPQYQVLADKADFGPISIGLGVAGLVPLLAISRAIESSESYLASGLNLSTNASVLRLFGSQREPIVTLVLSALMAGLTGVVEESTFRGCLIPFFANMVGFGNEYVGAALSTFLFAILHTNPQSLINPSSKDAFLDNAVLLALQLVNGSIFAYLYLSTGNLAVPIVAHSLYDFYTFYKTHMVDVAGQMEYAERETLMPICKSKQVEQQWVSMRGQDFVTEAKRTFYLMDTNQDGVINRKELRVALFSYGINLSQVQSQKVTKTADLDASGAIDMQEFLQYIGPSGSTSKAVRRTLFGPL